MHDLERRRQADEQYVNRAVEYYLAGLRRAEVQPNETLVKAIAKKALQEAISQHMEEARQIRDHNIAVIVRDHKRRLREIKRSEARLRLWMCPLIAAWFAGLAWYSVCYQHAWIAGMVFSIGALAFLAMLLLGAMFDR